MGSKQGRFEMARGACKPAAENGGVVAAFENVSQFQNHTSERLGAN